MQVKSTLCKKAFPLLSARQQAPAQAQTSAPSLRPAPAQARAPTLTLHVHPPPMRRWAPGLLVRQTPAQALARIQDLSPFLALTLTLLLAPAAGPVPDPQRVPETRSGWEPAWAGGPCLAHRRAPGGPREVREREAEVEGRRRRPRRRPRRHLICVAPACSAPLQS